MGMSVDMELESFQKQIAVAISDLFRDVQSGRKLPDEATAAATEMFPGYGIRCGTAIEELREQPFWSVRRVIEWIIDRELDLAIESEGQADFWRVALGYSRRRRAALQLLLKTLAAGKLKANALTLDGPVEIEAWEWLHLQPFQRQSALIFAFNEQAEHSYRQVRVSAALVQKLWPKKLLSEQRQEATIREITEATRALRSYIERNPHPRISKRALAEKLGIGLKGRPLDKAFRDATEGFAHWRAGGRRPNA